jgi:hypothetical protein
MAPSYRAGAGAILDGSPSASSDGVNFHRFASAAERITCSACRLGSGPSPRG